MELITDDVQKAFGLAWKAANDPDTPQRERAWFRAVAYLIWRGAGMPGAPAPPEENILARVLENLPRISPLF